jgi:hypothetical protein
MIDKDGEFLDEFEDRLHEAWKNGEVTNEFRNHMVTLLNGVRDWL